MIKTTVSPTGNKGQKIILTNNGKLLDDKDVPFVFNEYFSTIAGKLRSKIPIDNNFDPLSNKI